MKRIFSMLTILLLSLTTVVSAQSEVSMVDVQKADSLVNNPVKEKKGFQYGATLRYGGTFLFSSEAAFVLAGGYRFDRRNYLGLNVGVAYAASWVNWDTGPQGDTYWGAPISLDYTHYFPVGKSKKHSIILGAELGFIYSFGQSFLYEHAGDYNAETESFETEYEEVPFGGAIAVIKLGMDHPISQKMNLNWSLRLSLFTAGVGIGISF